MIFFYNYTYFNNFCTLIKKDLGNERTSKLGKFYFRILLRNFVYQKALIKHFIPVFSTTNKFVNSNFEVVYTRML